MQIIPVPTRHHELDHTASGIGLPWNICLYHGDVVHMLPEYFVLRVYSEHRVHRVLRVRRVLQCWRPKWFEHWEDTPFKHPKRRGSRTFEPGKFCSIRVKFLRLVLIFVPAAPRSVKPWIAAGILLRLTLLFFSDRHYQNCCISRYEILKYSRVFFFFIANLSGVVFLSGPGFAERCRHLSSRCS